MRTLEPFSVGITRHFTQSRETSSIENMWDEETPLLAFPVMFYRIVLSA
jgi:hypothetical protein